MPIKANRYANMTHEEFDRLLAAIVDAYPASDLLTVPGVHEIVSEHFNNDVLAAWDAEHADDAPAFDFEE